MQLDEQSVDTWPEPFTGGTGEEGGGLQEVRVTCNEPDVLETVVEETESRCVSDCFTAMHVLRAAQHT